MRHTMIILGALCGLIGLTACSGPSTLNAVTLNPDRSTEEVRDIAYGDFEAQKLDLYIPENAEGAPVLVFIHGGSWERGDKNEYRFVGRRFAAEGFVTAVIRYRLAPDYHYPDFVVDAAEAVVWLENNVARYKGDPETIFVSGHSAGGYNAVQLGVDASFMEEAGSSVDAIDGIIGLAGTYKFNTKAEGALAQAFGRAEPSEITQALDNVSGDEPPMLLLTGADDDVVDPRNASAMAEALTAVGVEARSISYPDADHSTPVVAIAQPRGRPPFVKDMVEFMQAQMASDDAATE